MGFGRRKRSHNKNNQYKKKIKLKTKIQFVGIILVAIGFIISLYDLKYPNSQTLPVVIGLIVIGMAMILQKKLWDGLKNMAKEHCNCCMCTNCGRNHNHWTHDSNDTRRSHY
ncbi:MAG: hypothetical protein KGZ34_00340 [Nitrosarchaeum sp.]|nr:hypothetical protein [Nitrosarchaeum sp.]